MSTQILVLAFASVLAVCTVISWFFRGGSGTIQAFFWGDQRLSLGLTASLVLTSSFSLNGLLYQAWLGYTIGWYSLIVQAIWCSSFALLVLRLPAFKEKLSEGTMHGIIGQRFGASTGKVAAVASIIGFSILIGWEAVVGATILREATGAGDSLYVILPLMLVFVAGIYTMSGGLRGNAIINALQNAFKIIVLGVAVVILVSAAPDGLNSLRTAPSATVAWTGALAALGGGVALFANLAFSFFWQTVDMSVWQSLAATKPKGRRLAAALAALLVFVFPGLIGSIIGIVLSAAASGASPISDTNILNRFSDALVLTPYAAPLLFAAFAASMLSTVDGYALSAAQASTWDLCSLRGRNAFALGTRPGISPR